MKIKVYHILIGLFCAYGYYIVIHAMLYPPALHEATLSDWINIPVVIITSLISGWIVLDIVIHHVLKLLPRIFDILDYEIIRK